MSEPRSDYEPSAGNFQTHEDPYAASNARRDAVAEAMATSVGWKSVADMVEHCGGWATYWFHNKADALMRDLRTVGYEIVLVPRSEPAPPSMDAAGYHEGCLYTAAVFPDRNAWFCNKCGRGGSLSAPDPSGSSKAVE